MKNVSEALWFFILFAGMLTVELAPESAHAGWNLTWNDEFNGAEIDTNHWTFENGNHNGWGNNELEYYTGRSQNAYVRDGLLHIVGRREPTNGCDYTSARMKSEGLYAQKYGRFEFRAKFPQGKGYWPALWLMPRNSAYGGWPECGEIDIVENKGDYPAVVQGTIHYSSSEGVHLQSTDLYTFAPGNGADKFHTYMLQWSTNSISWFVDNQLYETQTNWSTANAPYPAPFDQPFYIIMNLAIGGVYAGDPDTNTAFPGEMQVDFVRVYSESE
ncbi:MAG TPA: glycoside hydrolase family 16 protein [Verrucomicrobiae bacterium]|jgi:beta-glucanase (GH16 family)|nr:glycoside hydrolase family 16 protein [Verrucomicrobiae bacterium]